MSSKLLRISAFILAVVIVSLSFTSCSGKKKPGETADLDYISGNYQMIVDSVDKINCDYLLIYRSNASFAEIDSFVDFMEKLASTSSYTFQICPDQLNITDPKQNIILLGNTSYSLSKTTGNALNSIRSNNYYDYLLEGHGKTLSVMWKSKFGRDDAFNYILNNLLNNKFDNAFKPNYSYMYLSDRSDTPVVTIDDINIMQYSVVMSGSPSFIERSAAQRLVRAIKDATGVEVPLVTDAVEESRYEILIGDTNRGQSDVTSFFATKRYAIAQYGTKMILRGGQIEATSRAVNEFCDMVTNASITAAPLHITANYCTTGSISTYGGDDFNGYELVFSDEFNSSKVSDLWKLDKGSLGTYGNDGGLMYYYPENVDSDNNNLVITSALNEDGYNSGHVTTENSFSFKYGYVETRARFRTAPGVWIHFGLTNQNFAKDKVSQIDIVNAIGALDSVYSTAGSIDRKSYYHDYLNLSEPSYEGYRTGTFEHDKILNDTEFHTYGVEWTPDYIRYFIDGVSYGTVDLKSQKFKDLDTEMYFEIMLGVNMTDQIAVDETAAWPINIDVDWVRIYQNDMGVCTDRTTLPETNPFGTPETPVKK